MTAAKSIFAVSRGFVFVLLFSVSKVLVRWVFLVACAWVFTAPARADNPVPVHAYLAQEWRGEAELPEISVHALTQDADGFLWAGTEGGLSRFDGQEAEFYTAVSHHELARSWIVDQIRLQDDTVLIATQQNLVRFQDNQLSEIEGSRELGQLRAVDQAPDGSLWVAGDQLYHFEDGRFEPSGFWTDVAVDVESHSEGVWFICGYGYAHRWYQGKKTYMEYQGEEQTESGRVVPLSMAAIGARVYVATNRGLYTAEASSNELSRIELPVELQQARITALFASGERVWAAGGGRVFAIEGEQVVFEAGLNTDQDIEILSLYSEPGSDNFWMGTRTEGISYHWPNVYRRISNVDGLPHERVWTVIADGENLLVGTDAGVGSIRDDQASTYIDGQALGNSPAYALHRDRSGRLWIGTRAGLLSEDANGLRRWDSFDGLQINAITEEPDGSLWFATSGGVYQLNAGSGVEFNEEPALAGQTIRALTHAADGTLWAGSSNGLYFQTADNEWLLVNQGETPAQAGLASAHVLSMLQVENGPLLVGTNDNGIVMQSPTGWFHLNEASELPWSSIYSMTEVNDELWVSGSGGVFRMPISQIRRFDRSPDVDVIIHDLRLASMRTRVRCCNGGGSNRALFHHGKYWVPTLAGLLDLDPNQPYVEPPRVALRDVIAGTQHYRHAANIQLPADQRSIEFYFAAPSYGAKLQTEYRYRLGNSSNPWIELGDTQHVTLSNLGPGSNRFEVQARWRFEQWGPSRVVDFDIKPRFVESTAFTLLMTFSGLAVLVILFRLRSAQIKSQFLRDQYAYQAAVLDAVPNPIVVKGADSRYTAFNSAYERAFDVKRDDLIGKTLLDLDYLPTELRAQMQREDEQLLSKGGLSAREAVFTFADGEPHDVLYIRTTFTAGNSRGLIAVLVDISESKRALEELAEARDDAERAARARGEFLANMSHEIRTPLNAVIGMTTLAQAQRPTDPIEGYLKNIHSSAQLLLGLINDILDLSKIESGKLDFEHIPIALDELIQQLIDMMEPGAEDKRLDFKLLKPEQSLPTVLGDPLRIKQVLINLMSNAIKFTERGSVTLAVTLRGERDGRQGLAFSVEDTGIGMSSAQINQLFTPFTQADSSISRRFGGTGLGLTIVKQLVDHMDGDIQVTSEPEKGSVFTVILWLESYHSSLSLEEQTIDSKLAESVVSVDRPGRILIAEDNHFNQQVIEGLLEMEGLRYDTVANGRLALEAADPTIYGLILMDLQMPEMDGLTATREIRKRFSAEELPILAMTANADDESNRATSEAGMNAHLNKPVDRTILTHTLRRFLPNSAFDAAPASSDGAQSHATEASNVTNATPFAADTVMRKTGTDLAELHVLLDRFLTDHQHDLRLFAQRMTEGDRDGAGRIAHNLKSIGGMLGSSELQSSAEALQTALKNADIVIDDSLVSQFNESFEKLVTDIRDYLETQARDDVMLSVETSGVDPQQLLLELTNAISEFDPRADALCFALIEALVGKVDTEQLQLLSELETACHHFEFEEAGKILDMLEDLLKQT